MGERPGARVSLRQAIVAVLIAPSVVGSVALLVAEPGAGVILGGATLGMAIGILRSARRRGRVTAGVLGVVIACLGAFMSFALLLGWASSSLPFRRDPTEAGGLAMLAFLAAIPASIVALGIQASRSDHDGDTSAGAGVDSVAIAAIPLTIGAYIGYSSAYPWNASGGPGELGRAVAAGPAITLLVALVIAAVVGIVTRRMGPRGARAGRLAVRGGVILGIAALGAFLLTPVLGLAYGTPVVAFGSATLRFDSLQTFTPKVGGYAECEAVGGAGPTSVYGELGWLESGELNALLLLGADGPDLFLVRRPGDSLRGGPSEISYMRDLSFYVARPTVIHEFETTNQAMSGRVSFHLPRLPSDQADGGWPAARSGELRWTCGAWLGPATSYMDRGTGRLEVRLDGVDWVQTDASAGCELEAGASVGYLWSASAGLLDGTTVEVTIDLRSTHVAGSEADVWIQVVDPDATTDQELPWWNARLTLDEVSEGDRSGRAAFVDMPRYGPASTDLADTLTGELIWSCS